MIVIMTGWRRLLFAFNAGPLVWGITTKVGMRTVPVSFAVIGRGLEIVIIQLPNEGGHVAMIVVLSQYLILEFALVQNNDRKPIVTPLDQFGELVLIQHSTELLNKGVSSSSCAFWFTCMFAFRTATTRQHRNGRCYGRQRERQGGLGC